MTHSDGQVWGDIEWAIELLYNSAKTGSQLVWRPEVGDKMRRESHNPAEGAFGSPIEFEDRRVWRSEILETRCGSESQHSAESWAPGPPVEQLWRTRKTQRLWLIEWGSIYCSSVLSPTSSHTQTFQIKWDVYFSKRPCRSSLLCVVMTLHAYVDVYVLCVCIVNHGHGYAANRDSLDLLPPSDSKIYCSSKGM